jgi:hypothetical protein
MCCCGRERERIYALITPHIIGALTERRAEKQKLFFFPPPRARTTAREFIYLFICLPRAVCALLYHGVRIEDKIRSSTYVGAVESRWSLRTHGLIAGTRGSSLICNLQVGAKVFALITCARTVYFLLLRDELCFCGETVFCTGSTQRFSPLEPERRRKKWLAIFRLELFCYAVLKGE